MSYQVIKNFLDQNNFLNLKKLMTSNDFPWFIKWGINYENKDEYQFTHNFYNNYTFRSSCHNLLNPFLLKLNPKAILRIKANLLVQSNEIIKHGFHIDNEVKHSKTAIFYVNTNNGFTEFENGEISKSEENKLIIFNNTLKHTGTTCTDELFRIVINFNYVE